MHIGVKRHILYSNIDFFRAISPTKIGHKSYDLVTTIANASIAMHVITILVCALHMTHTKRVPKR
jgi:hypothetical protein